MCSWSRDGLTSSLSEEAGMAMSMARSSQRGCRGQKVTRDHREMVPPIARNQSSRSGRRLDPENLAKPALPKRRHADRARAVVAPKPSELKAALGERGAERA